MTVVVEGQSNTNKRQARSRRGLNKKTVKRRLARRSGRVLRKKKGRRRKVNTRRAPKEKPILPSQIESEQLIAYENGYRIGKYDGGELVLAHLIPENMVLPDISVEHVIGLGYEQVKGLLQPLLHPDELYMEVHAALQEKRPFSLVRLGDGELLAMSHDKVLSTNLVLQEGPFLEYSGIRLPDHEYRDQLAESIRHATVVGVPMARIPNYQGLLLPVFRAYGLRMSQMRLTSSTVNYMLALQGYLLRLLQDKHILIVGNIAEELAAALRQRGLSVSGVVQPVQGMQDIPRVMQEIAQHHFDVALVAAGVPAVILSERIASQYGKVALDIGHLANKIASGEAAL